MTSFHKDGAGRRIHRHITNAGELDGSYNDYHMGQSVVETRNNAPGGGAVLKQRVWAGSLSGGGYIDELIHIAVNGDPLNDPDFDPTDPDHDFRGYFALHDANYNVTELYDDTDVASGGGVLVERYAYDPYGRRQVYTPTDATDPFGETPIPRTQRVVDANGIPQTYGLCRIGHQGLAHDEETGSGGGLIYNRARMRSVHLGRFIQRDPLGYVDGMSVYAGYHTMQSGVDPSGLGAMGHGTFMGDGGSDYAIADRHEQQRKQAAATLKKLCNDTCIAKCTDCDKEKCEKEAEMIARRYANAVRSQKARQPWWNHAVLPGNWFPGILHDIRGGLMCSEWRTLIFFAVDSNSLECFKVSGGATIRPNGDVPHNWVNVTVADQPEPRGDCTRRLDPWKAWGRRPAIYNDSNHGHDGTGVFLRDPGIKHTRCWIGTEHPIGGGPPVPYPAPIK